MQPFKCPESASDWRWKVNFVTETCRFAVPLTYELEGAWNAKVDTWHNVEIPAASVWQGCTELLRRFWMTCKQVVRRFRGAGTARRRCSGPVKELDIECVQGLRDRDCTQRVRRVWMTGTVNSAQGLGDRDCTQCAGSGWQGLYTVRRVWVTGTVHSAQGLGDRDCSQCAGPAWQGLYTDSAQGLGDRDSTWHRARVTHSAEVKGRRVSSRSCESLAAAVLLAGCSDVSRSESLRPYLQIQYINCTYRRSKMANCHPIWKLVRLLVLLSELFNVPYLPGKTVLLFLIFYCTVETGQ